MFKFNDMNISAGSQAQKAEQIYSMINYYASLGELTNPKTVNR